MKTNKKPPVKLFKLFKRFKFNKRDKGFDAFISNALKKDAERVLRNIRPKGG